MSARVLVVDDMPANRKILEAKLSASYYSVVTAANGQEALDKVQIEKPDLILLDVMMPGMDGFECCRRLKSDPETSHIPVVMITALDQSSDRIRGLEAGADDFLTKPPNDLALFARVRSLVRVKMMIDELQMRDDTLRDLGADAPSLASGIEPSGHVTIVDERASRAQSLARAISSRLKANCATFDCGADAIEASRTIAPDLFVVARTIGDEDGLRLCSELRSSNSTRQSGIIVMVDHDDFESIASALDLGANDYIMRPVDENEFAARVRAQLLRKNYADKLRESVYHNMRLAVTDELTGVYNRRYVEQHLQRQISHCADSGAALSVMMLDLDKFKNVNDTHGHSAGDDVLRDFAKRAAEQLRGVDLVGRYGGEEFVVVMPETTGEAARVAAERVRKAVGEKPFVTQDGVELTATVSIGVAEVLTRRDTARSLIERADEALYVSKRNGRDRVSVSGDNADVA
ncbi:MAG: PleD family two-component system response regulator [Pseudomonadota bacterium]